MTLASVPDQDAPPEGRQPKQLRFDGMPVTGHKVSLTGTVSVSEEAAKQWKLGSTIELTVAGVVSSRRHKAGTNFGEPTGDAEHQVTIHITDLVLDEDGEE